MKLLFVIFLSCAVAQAAVDVYQDMEASTQGTTLTTSIVTNGAHGLGSWSTVGSMTVSTNKEATLRGPVTVGTATYLDGSGTRGWRSPDNVNSAAVTFTPPTSKSAVVISGFITIGPPGHTFELYDYAHVRHGGDGSVMQLDTFDVGGPKMTIEVYNGGTTDHAGKFAVTQGETYWYTFKVAASPGNCELAFYETNAYTQVGSLTKATLGGSISDIIFGVGSPHNNTSATFTYFDDICISWVDTTWPFIPAASARVGGIPVHNAPTNVWAVAGVPGGIPTRNTVYTNLSPGITAATLQTHINNCPSNQVVLLAAGTYSMAALDIDMKDGWTLRGAGMGQTILNITSGVTSFTIGGAPPFDGTYNNTVSITSGGFQGATNLTVSSATGYTNGSMVVIDMVNRDWITDGGVGSSGSLTTNDDAVGKNRDGVRAQAHYCHVTGVSGSVVTIWPPLPYDLEPERTPQISRFGTSSGQIYRGPMLAGIEDLTLNCGPDTSGSAMGIKIYGTYGFWLKNVEILDWGAFGVWNRRSACFEMRGCYIHDPNTYSVDHGYGIQLDPVNGSLIVDNIVYNCQSTFLFQGGSAGNVVAYNALCFGKYVNGGFTGEWLQHEISGDHSPFPCYNLFEGNYTGKFQADYYYGPSGWNTLFRNRIPGNSSATDQNRFAVGIDSHSRNYSVVGNQLGERTAPSSIFLALPNVTRTYTEPGTLTWTYGATNTDNFSYTAERVYRLGYPYSGQNSSGSGLDTIDNEIKTDTLLHANWDAANNGVVYVSGLSVDLPNSLFLTAAPSWFGSLSWPPYGTNAPTSASTDIAKIPAGYRLLNNAPPGGGGPLITSATNATATNFIAYSYQITADQTIVSYGAAPLPNGLTVSAGGLISGTLNIANSTVTTNITLTVTNASGNAATNFALQVVALGTPVINSATTADGTNGVPFSYQITGTQYPTNFGATGLPTGVTVAAATGILSGTPTVDGVFVITLQATNAVPASDTETLTLTIAAPAPVLLVSPSSLSFVEQPETVTNFLTFGLTNNGSVSSSLTCHWHTASSPFSAVAPTNVVLAGGTGTNVTIQYAPTSKGTNNSTAVFVTNVGNITNNLTGIAGPLATNLTMMFTNALVVAPFVVTASSNSISQTTFTAEMPQNGGRATYWFYATNAGVHTFTFIAYAAATDDDSMYFNLDAEPTDPDFVWPFLGPVNYVSQNVALGIDGLPFTAAHPFTLTQGYHQIVVRGREANARLRSVTLVPPPGIVVPPGNVKITGVVQISGQGVTAQ